MSGRRPRSADLACAVALFLAALVVYRASPIRDMSDSQYTLVFSEQLLRHGTMEVASVLGGTLDPSQHPGLRNGLPYQLERCGGRLYPRYPPGSPMLSAPLLAVAKAFGTEAIAGGGAYHMRREQKVQAKLASLLMAVLVVVSYATARLLLPTGASVAVALATAFGTQVYSTASRTLWSDTWGILLLAIVVLLLLRQEVTGRQVNGWLLGTLLSWLYLAKPTYATAILPVTAFIAWRSPARLPAVVATGAAWLASFVLWSRNAYGSFLPPYYTQQLSTAHLLEGLAGTLVSPSRGLIVYTPALIWVGVTLVRRWRHLPHRALAVAGLSTIALHLLVAASYPIWWAGHCYGPRATVGLVPWFVLLGSLALAPGPAADRGARPHGAGSLAAAVALLAVSVALHARGAIAESTRGWSAHPEDIDHAPQRAWDWRYPQFLAGILPLPLPPDFPRMKIGVPAIAGHASTDPIFWHGWGDAEGIGRWSARREATAIFRFPPRGSPPIAVVLEMEPYLHPPELTRQQVRVELNGHLIGELSLTRRGFEHHRFEVAATAWGERNQLTLHLPDATSIASLERRGDAKLLGVCVRTLELEAAPRAPRVR